VSLWFSCSGQLNKKGTLISLPLNKTGNGIQIDVSGTNMIYTGWNNGIPAIASSAYIYLPLTNDFVNYGTGPAPDISGIPVLTTQSSKKCTYFDNAATTGASTQNRPLGNQLFCNFLSNNTTDFTIGAWVYAFTGYYNPFGIFLDGTTTTIVNIDIGLNNTNLVQFYSQSGASFSLIGQSTSYSFVTQWVHMVLVRPQPSSGNGTCIAYINGVNIGSAALAKSNNIPNKIIVGGGSHAGVPTISGRGYKGYIRHFTAYNRALSSTEITELYNATINL